MASTLEQIPHDVLAHIAFLCASSSLLEPPVAIVRLSLTSRAISSKFDLAAARRRIRPSVLTTSALSAEFVQRCRVLQRIRRGHISNVDVQDLFTAYTMLLESDGLNEVQLLAAGFPRFIAEFIRSQYATGRTASLPPSNHIRSLALWSFWLTLSRQAIINQSTEQRNEILLMLRPFVIYGNRSLGTSISPSSLQAESNKLPGPGTEKRCQVVYYAQPMALPQLNLSSVSILLTFVLYEAPQLRVPRHLPPTRAIADAIHYFGPTMEDYSVAAGYRTLLPADTHVPFAGKVTASPAQSILHDQDVSRVFRDFDPSTFLLCSELFPYSPGMLNGLWEGHYMVSPSVPPSSSPRTWPDFLLRQPLQCFLREYLYCSPNATLPGSVRCVAGEEDSADWSIDRDPHRYMQEMLELRDSGSSRKLRHDPLLPAIPSASRGGDARIDAPQEVLGIFVTGETLPEHDQAWGAYNFSGSVRLRDGLVILMRKPKSFGDDSMGTWIFEGYIHAGSGFVGRWYSSSANDQHGFEGIFSMRKRHDPGQK